MKAKEYISRKKKTASKDREEASFPKGLCFSGFATDGNPVRVYTKNGKIVRISPLHFDWKYDRKGFNPWEMEARGKVFQPGMKALVAPYSLAYKKRIYSPNRILYPLKRVDWDPDGDRSVQNRGKSGYVRISWEEALEIIVNEINRVKEKYGPYAILSQSDGHGETKVVHGPHGCARRLLELLGGYTLQTRNTDSWEGWYWGAKHAWGMEPVGQQAPVTNVMFDIARNAEIILFWGCDPETTPWGFDGQMASRMCYWFTELGVRSIYICPDLNYGAAVHADKWIPVRPNTDAALHLAIAYVWITEGIYDKEYVASHTFGFEKFEPYVLGKEDGIPKTPGWAAEITGIPEWTIKALAREWSSRRTSIAHGNGGPGIRSQYSTEPGRLEILLLAMKGLGKPGCNQVKMIEWGLHQRQPMPNPLVAMRATYAHQGRQFKPAPDGTVTGELPKQIIPKDLIHEAILNPPLGWYGSTLSREPVENQFVKYRYPVAGCSEIHMIWTDTPCWITCWNDSNSYIRALRSPKIEFILAQHPWLENDCLFADIILPVSTKFEQEDISMQVFGGHYHAIMRERKCIEPVGESKSDYDIVCLIAERLGLLKEYTEGRSVQEWIKYGYETSGVQDMISYQELEEKDYWVVPTDPKWKEYPPGLKNFYEEPEKNPLKTPSGKVEFYSQNLAKHFPDDKERPPVPHWIPYGESHQESLLHPRAKKYPLLIMSNHGRWRVHANHDDITWTREIPTCKVKGPDGYKYEPLWINPVDAAARRIESGDVVEIYNERGRVLGGAYVTERIRPGVVYMDHGARYDPIVPGELDRGGAINTITPHNITSKNATGMVCSSFLVEVKKADLDDLRMKHQEAFQREYDSASGLRFNAWVEKGV
jgi:molybdopterin guanine dinucleotide-containing S/N-oxide reductase-like protein